MTLTQLLDLLLRLLNPPLRQSGDARPPVVAASYQRLRGIVAQCPDELAMVPTNEEIRRFVELLLEHTPPDRLPLAAALRLLGKLPGHCLRFERLEPNTIIYQLLLRVVDPNRIDQGQLGLCGTVTSQLPFLASNPHQFAQLAAELLVYGCLALPGQAERPVPSEILTADPGGSLPQADWLVLASIRAAPTWQVTELLGTPKQGGFGSANAEDMFAICRRQYGTCALLRLNDGTSPQFHPSKSGCLGALPQALLDERGILVHVRRRRLDLLIECLQRNCIVMLEADAQLAFAAQNANPAGLARAAGVSHWVLLETCTLGGGAQPTVSYRIRTWKQVYSVDGVPLDRFLAMLMTAIIIPPMPDAQSALRG